MFFFYPIKEEIPQTSDCRDILSLSKDWAFEFLLGKRSANPALDWTQLTEDWRSTKGKPNPPVLSGNSHLDAWKSPLKSWCGAELWEEPEPNPAEVTGKSSPLFGGPQSVQREREGRAGAELEWQSWEVQVKGREHLDLPSLQASRATCNAALQSFPLNSLKLLDGKRQYSCFYDYFLSPFARWSLFWGEAERRPGWIFKGISGKDLWANRW